MPKSPEPRAASRSPALSKRRLARILGLQRDAPRTEIETALPRLLGRLGQRLDHARDTLGKDAPESHRLQREIADLATSSASIASSTGPFGSTAQWNRRATLGLSMLVAALTLCLLVAYAAGYRVVQSARQETAASLSTPGLLILEGALDGATLRVLDADRKELFLKTSANEAHVEVPPGRVTLEVSREDCPDQWTQSVYFEEGSTHRFEPELCLGTGRLTVRSNVSADRLRIDGLDAGTTHDRAHELQVGDHEIRVNKSGYQPFVGTVRIRPDEDLEIRAELIAVGAGGPAQGRPMPVTKHAPTKTPSSLTDSRSFDLSELRDPIVNPSLDLGADALPPLHDRPRYYTAAAAGSTRWHDRVSADMIARYDLDASGQIDRLEESEAISCRVWRELERDFDGGGLGLSMVHYFGFDGSEWHPKALGFARAHRSAAFAKMKECGLQA